MKFRSPGEVRPPVIAGTWYPGDADSLRRAVSGYIAAANPPDLPRRPVAVICPHAGYTYSGPTAGWAYRPLSNDAYDRVVVLGPLHRPIAGRLGPLLVPAEAAYRTPLGDVPVDQSFLADLAQLVDLQPVEGDQEHSIEIQLPFLQTALHDFVIAPVMLGVDLSSPATPAAVPALAEALTSLADDRTLIVVSTDLSHLHHYSEVRRIDKRLMDLFELFDPESMLAAFGMGEVQACGGAGLVAAMMAAHRLGASRAEVLAYATSGDVSGNTDPGTYTVGYMAAVLA